MVRMEGRATDELLAQARAGEIGGVILFPPSDIAGDRLAAELKRLQAAAREGGYPRLLRGDRPGGRDRRAPAGAAAAALAVHPRPERRSPGRRARGTRDRLPAPRDRHRRQPRAGPGRPGFRRAVHGAARIRVDAGAGRRASALAFASGQRREGVAATGKHFPGLGRAVENTDFAPTTIATSRAGLRADMTPFRAATEHGIELIMLSSAAYPALDGRRPAVLYPAIATDLLRERARVRGRDASATTCSRPRIAASYPRRAGRGARLGGRRRPTAVRRRATLRGSPPGSWQRSESGELEESRLRASCARIVELKERLATGRAAQGRRLQPPGSARCRACSSVVARARGRDHPRLRRSP